MLRRESAAMQNFNRISIYLFIINLPIQLSIIHPSICTSIHLFYVSISLSIHLQYTSIHLSSRSLVNPSNHPSTYHPLVHLSIQSIQSIHPLEKASIIPPVHPSVHPSIGKCIHHSIHPHPSISNHPFIHPSIMSTSIPLIIQQSNLYHLLCSEQLSNHQPMNWISLLSYTNQEESSLQVSHELQKFEFHLS